MLRTERESQEAAESKAVVHPTQSVRTEIAEGKLGGSCPGRHLDSNLHENVVKHGTARPVAMKCSHRSMPVAIHHSPGLLMTHQTWEPGFRALLAPQTVEVGGTGTGWEGVPPASCPRLSLSPHGGSSPKQVFQRVCVANYPGGTALVLRLSRWGAQPSRCWMSAFFHPELLSFA